MTWMELRESLSYPLVGLIFLTGLSLTIKIRFFQIRHIFLGLKILSGSQDWKETRGKISPGQAFSAGTASALVPGAALGTYGALSLYGAGALYWIWIFTLLAMAVQYASSVLSLHFRSKQEEGALLTGPAVYGEQALPFRWVSWLTVLLFLSTSLLSGNLLPLGMLSAAFGHSTLSFPSVSLSIVTALLLLLILSGGVRLVGRTARSLFLPALFLLLPALFLLYGTLARLVPGESDTGSLWLSLLQHGQAGFWPVGSEGWKRLILAMGTYLVLAEVGPGKLSVLTGTVRTDYAAKQGLASMLAPLFQGLLTATGTAYLFFVLEGVSSRWGLSPLALLFAPGTPLPLAGRVLFLFSLTALLVAGMGGWIYAGSQTARFLGGRRAGMLFSFFYLAVLVGGGFYLRIGGESALLTIYHSTILVAMAASLLPLLALFPLVRVVRFEQSRFFKERPVRSDFLKDLILLLMTLLPKSLLSRLFGWLTYLHLPRFLMLPILKAFAVAYRINLDEAELELKEYPSLNKFFTRALRDGARVVDKDEDTVVSPVDARISEFGDIVGGRMIQAKGIQYTLADLLDWDYYLSRFQGGKFIVLYLSPQDYHRIHSPYQGIVTGYSYVPGKLFAVNEIAVKGLHGLFPKNERLTTYLKTDGGMIAVVKVGATNVGRIKVTYDTITTNRWIRIPRNHLYRDRTIPMGRGEELGRFEMGSTVILLFEQGAFEFLPTLQSEQKIRFGEPLGRLVR